IGTGGPHRSCSFDDPVDRQSGGIDNLSEDSHVMPRQIGTANAPSKIRRQIFEFVGTADELDAKFSGEIFEIGPAATGNHDLIRPARTRRATADDALAH